ncbi:iron complex transport system substrate-binding protein [Dethiosulfatibacter aminovorans DSM 17477]|uniref:Iron complex transport system substrate-binding protein n=1 Tax=Dethiosulfatibacter aminovorans DSM 17477 TaxID=1121476 RepID=A0A1M6CXT2_9FIRM|nr:helical backbone metal receptor [Dethiosulfatibacter aminovorans]SHI65885.1 iron complex transport system substrate-binding protein [Dethiosulfatibacter aminovorans DSM 17477]
MKRRVLTLLMIIVLIFTLAGCIKNEETTDGGLDSSGDAEDGKFEDTGIYPVTITDDTGRQITIEEMPKRLVSTVPGNTEIIFGIGKGENLVGVSAYCNYPEEALEIEKIGDYDGPDTELIIGLDPDVVFGSWMSNDVVARLEDEGIIVVLVDPGNLEETYETMLIIGDVVGASEEADQMVSNLKAKQEMIMKRVSGYEAKTVFFEIWDDPLTAAGPGSFHHELITLANGVNIAGDTGSPYPEYSPNELIAENPQVYLTADDGFKTAEEIFAREGYDNIEAIETEQLFMLNQDIVSRKGPRMIEALEKIAAAIHPEAFNEK